MDLPELTPSQRRNRMLRACYDTWKLEGMARHPSPSGMSAAYFRHAAEAEGIKVTVGREDEYSTFWIEGAKS